MSDECCQRQINQVFSEQVEASRRRDNWTVLKKSRVSTSRERKKGHQGESDRVESDRIPLSKWENSSLLRGKVCFVICKGTGAMERHTGEVGQAKTVEGLECCTKETGFYPTQADVGDIVGSVLDHPKEQILQ